MRCRAPLARAALAAAAALLGAAAFAEPSAPALARQCATCHGPLGVSVAPDAPHLAGQPRRYLSEQLRAYRSGARRHAVMNVVAKPLDDVQIEALATWYASVEVEARAPGK